jgi:hypothetical protein
MATEINKILSELIDNLEKMKTDGKIQKEKMGKARVC